MRQSRQLRLSKLEIKNEEPLITNVMINVLEKNKKGNIAIIENQLFFSKNKQQQQRMN